MTRRVVAAVLLPALGIAAALTPSRPTSAQPKPPAGEVPAYAFVVNFAQVWDHKAFTPFREARGKAEFAWAVQGLLGIAPADLQLVVGVARSGVPNGPVLWVTTRKPVDAAAVAKSLSRDGKPAESLGSGLFKVAVGEFEYVQQAVPKGVYLVPRGADRARVDEVLRGLADTPRPEVGTYPTVMLTLQRPILESVAGPLPPELKDVISITFEATLRGESEMKAHVTFRTRDLAAAEALRPKMKGLLGTLAAWADAKSKQLAQQPQDGGTPGPLLELVAGAMRKADLSVQTGATPGVRASATVDAPELVGRVMVALPESVFAGGAIGGNARAINNLKQIGLAMHNYHDTHNHLPANSYAKDGTPLLSWRVHILPYIEQNALYQQFKLDEPWDSPNNKPLLNTVVQVYAIPGRPAPNVNETFFRAFIGPKNVKPDYRPLLTEGESKGPTLVQIPDGTSNTFMVVEAGKAVPWTKPDDLEYDGVMAVPTLGGPSGQFLALFCDGSVRTGNRNRNAESTLRGYITIGGGEVVPPLR
jgi:hypothetical protein